MVVGIGESGSYETAENLGQDVTRHFLPWEVSPCCESERDLQAEEEPWSVELVNRDEEGIYSWVDVTARDGTGDPYTHRRAYKRGDERDSLSRRSLSLTDTPTE